MTSKYTDGNGFKIGLVETIALAQGETKQRSVKARQGFEMRLPLLVPGGISLLLIGYGFDPTVALNSDTITVVDPSLAYNPTQDPVWTFERPFDGILYIRAETGAGNVTIKERVL